MIRLPAILRAAGAAPFGTRSGANRVGPGREGGRGPGDGLRRFHAAHGSSARSMWLVSFTDLISLLLAFFVLMFSMAEPQPQRFAELARGVSARSTATRPSDARPEPGAVFNAPTVEPVLAANLDYLAALFRNQMAADPLLADLPVRREDDRVVIGLAGSRLFLDDGPGFSDSGRRLLFLLGDALGRIGNRVEVVGHAEREVDSPGQEWERALSRAAAVSMAIRESGYRRDLVARAVVAPGSRDDAAQGPLVDLVIREQRG